MRKSIRFHEEEGYIADEEELSGSVIEEGYIADEEGLKLQHGLLAGKSRLL